MYRKKKSKILSDKETELLNNEYDELKSIDTLWKYVRYSWKYKSFIPYWVKLLYRKLFRYKPKFELDKIQYPKEEVNIDGE